MSRLPNLLNIKERNFFDFLLKYVVSQDMMSNNNQFERSEEALASGKFFSELFSFVCGSQDDHGNEYDLEEYFSIKIKVFLENFHKDIPYDEDFRFKKFNALRRYLRGLKECVNSLVHNQQAPLVILHLQKMLEDQCDLYDTVNPDIIDNVKLMARSNVTGLLIRVKVFAEMSDLIISDEICKGIDSDASSDKNSKKFDILEQNKFIECAYEFIWNKANQMLRKKKAVLKSTEQPLGVSQRGIMSTSRNSLLQANGGRLTLKEKWKLLSTGKKIIFLSILALEIMTVIAAAVFIPGSPLFTLPAIGIVSGRLLGALAGGLLVARQGLGIRRSLDRAEYLTCGPGLYKANGNIEKAHPSIKTAVDPKVVR